MNEAVRFTMSPTAATAQEVVSLNISVTEPSSVAAPTLQLSNVRVRTPASHEANSDCTHEPA